MVQNAIGMKNDDANNGISVNYIASAFAKLPSFCQHVWKSASSLKALFTNESADVRRGIYVFDFAD